MPLRRGFKTYANALAVEFRTELRLGPNDPFDPRLAAEYLGIPVLAFGDLYNCDARVLNVLRSAGAAVSGFTIFGADARTIVYNDGHTLGRINNTLAHEISHAILIHEPVPAIGLHGCREVNRDAEAEADFLAGALLLPESVCLACARAALDSNEIAKRYGVSAQLATYRMNITGALGRIARSRRNARRPGRVSALR